MKHANLSIFVPHAGCPHRCSFCNQCEISGAKMPPNGAQVTEICTNCASSLPKSTEAEIAFFGGSFTALDREYMVELLEAAFPFVKNGSFSGIRISTRPDYIDNIVLDILREYGVTAIELGAQSMNDDVLYKNERGHIATDVEHSAVLIKKAGFSLGLQMMTGLYGSNVEKERLTAKKLADLKPDTIRIYPTLVLEGTKLAKLFREGNYCPQTSEEAVSLGAELLGFFSEKRIRVIRMGLHDEDDLRKSLVAGPHLPAYREICEGLLLARRMEICLREMMGKNYLIYVAPTSLSKMFGHGAFAVEYLRRLGYTVKVKQDQTLLGLEFRIEDVDNASAQLGNTRLQIVSGSNEA